MDLRSRLARGAGIAAAGFALTRAISFATIIVLASLIDPSDVGELAAGTVIIGTAMLFAEGGMLSALIQSRDENIDRAASTAFVSTFAAGIALSLAALATAPLVAVFFDSRDAGVVAAVCSGWLFLRALQVVPDALLQRRMSFVRRVVVDPIGAVAYGATAIGTCSYGLGVWGLVAGAYAQLGVQVIAAWAFVGWRPRVRDASWVTWKQLAGYARYVVASELIRRVTVQLDTIVLGRAAGTAALGQYRYGMRIATTPTDAWVNIAAYVLFPGLARIAHDPGRFRRAFLDSLAVMYVLALPVALLLLVLADDLVLLMLGPDWPLAADAVRGLAGLCIGQSLASLASEVFKAAGRPSLLVRLHTLAFAASVVLLPALVWADVAGIALAVSIVALTQGVWAVRRAAQLVEAPVAVVLRRLGRITMAATVPFGCVVALDATVFSETHDRVAALVPILAESTCMALLFLAGLRICAPAELQRLRTAVSYLRRRPRTA
jgi:O-antigen/teichoic acid export membrane protein